MKKKKSTVTTSGFRTRKKITAARTGLKNKIRTGAAKGESMLLHELSLLIERSRNRVAVVANSALAMLFWQVGRRINGHILQNRRAAYGKEIVSTLSTQLRKRFGANFEERNLRRMMQFADQFRGEEIVSTLSRQLSWSHFITLLPLKNEETRLFYANRSAEEYWGVRELRESIARKEFERHAIAKTQLRTASPDVIFKDPYFLDFLGLKDGYLEKDLETAILKELERFILEFGKSFAFVARQKRMIIDGEDNHLDLLFFHRKLKRLVAIDLKSESSVRKTKGRWNSISSGWIAMKNKRAKRDPSA